MATRSVIAEHVHEGKRRKLVGGRLPACTQGPIGNLTLTNNMYWCPNTGEAWAVMEDAHRGEFQLYATGLYFEVPFNRLTRGSVRMLAAIAAAAGRYVVIVEKPDGDTVLRVTMRNGNTREVSASLLASNTARYAVSVHALVQTLISQIG